LEEGKALTIMGLIATEQNEPASARQYNEQALAIARELQNRALEGSSLNNLANAIGFLQGEYSVAQEYYEQAYAIFHLRGDRSNEGLALSNLGWVAGMQGDFTAAFRYHMQALPIVREVEHRNTEINTLINLSAVSGMIGNVETALQYASEAREMSVKHQDKSGEAWSWLYQGHAYLLVADFEQATMAFQRSRAIREELGQTALVAESVAGLIQSALGRGDFSTATRETEWILTHLANNGTLEGAEEPLRIYFACYKALSETKDPRWRNLLLEAKQSLEAQVSKISDKESRRRYVENVPWRRDIQQASSN
jgi:tetratricopeptide (TPR) repeat protein